MKARRIDLIAATILLAFAIAWSVTVYQTVPTSTSGIGPRAFPLILGILLIAMSALLLLRTFGARPAAEDVKEDEAPNPELAGGGKFALGIFLLIILYGFLIERIGFLLTTPVIIIGALVVLLRMRNPAVILALAFGITVGCWLVFNKMLGIYMPPGSWVSFHI